MAEKIEIPKDINPRDFFEKFIPEQFEKNKDKLPEETKSLSASMAFQINGEQGGVWTVKFDRGSLQISQGESPDRVVKIIQSINDWRDAISGERGFRLDLPGTAGESVTMQMGMGKGSTLTQERIERLRSLDGAIMFRLTDPSKGDWAITVKFGSSEKAEPDCTISLKSEDAQAMRKGELNPQMAFMSGKIDIKGDLGLAMQIGTSLMM